MAAQYSDEREDVSDFARELARIANLESLAGCSVLVLSLTPILNIHFAAELEIIRSLLDADTRVHVLVCDRDLPTCHPNPSHLSSVCTACASTGARTLKKVFEGSSELNVHKVSIDLVDVPQTKRVKLDNREAEFLRAARSSAASAFKDPESTSEGFQLLVEKGVASARTIYENVTRILMVEPIKLVVVFNGRFSEDAGAVLAAREHGCPVVTHERSGSGSSVRLFPDASTHSLDHVKRELRDLECRVPFSEILHEGKTFFEAQRYGLSMGPHGQNIFVRGQKELSLPIGFDEGRKNIAVLLSSEDEFTVLKEWKNPFGEDQLSVLRQLINLDGLVDYQFWVRVHPSLAHRSQNSLVMALRELASDHVKIVEAGSQVSSYQLALKCYNVISFGSTLGAEVAYWGCNTILLGRSEYESLGCCHIPEKIDAIPALLVGSAPADAARRALIYGAFRRREYLRFSWTQPDKRNRFLEFDGSQIRASHFCRLKSRILRLLDR